MKSIIIVLFLSLSSAFQLNIQQRPSTPDELAKAVYNALKQKSFTDFEKLLFTEADCDTVVINSNLPDSIKADILPRMKGLTQLVKENAEKNFKSVIEQAEQKGIDWTKVEFTEAKYEIKTRDIAPSSDIFFGGKQGDIEFYIKLDNCHKSNAWLIMDEMEIHFK